MISMKDCILDEVVKNTFKKGICIHFISFCV